MPSRPTREGLRHVRVQPKARASAIVGWQAGTLRVRVTAAPEDGRANRAVIELLAESLSIPPSSIALVRGAASRDKWFRLPAGAVLPE